jgi:hypothetical protein
MWRALVQPRGCAPLLRCAAPGSRRALFSAPPLAIRAALCKAPQPQLLRVRALRAHGDERGGPSDYMSALEDELSERPDAPPPPPPPPKGDDDARSGAGVTWHSALTVGQVRMQAHAAPRDGRCVVTEHANKARRADANTLPASWHRR